MPLLDIELTKADFDLSGWQEVLADVANKECHIYSRMLFLKAREAEAAGESRSQAIFDLLGGIASLYLRADNSSNPFGPMIVLGTERSLILDDLTSNHWSALKAIRQDIRDAEMRARICDCLWIGKRDGRAGRDAIDAYVTSAATLEDIEHWPRMPSVSSPHSGWQSS